MKKLIFSLLAFSVLAGCSKRENLDEKTSGELVPIQLNSGVLLSKSPITDGTSFTANVAGWETTGTIDYSVTSSWLATTAISATQTPAGITLNPVQHYSTDSATKTYMKAWYPAISSSQVSSGKVNFGGVDYKNDGTMDVLYASQIVGDKVNSTGKVLTFNHLLSQVNFKVVASAGLQTTPKLNSITIVDAELPTGINLVSNELICAPAANLAVPNITAGALVIDQTSKSAGDPVMFKPFAGKTFLITVVTSERTYPNAVVTIDDTAFVQGKAYTITITFKSINEIILSAVVTPWLTGSGSATVE